MRIYTYNVVDGCSRYARTRQNGHLPGADTGFEVGTRRRIEGAGGGGGGATWKGVSPSPVGVGFGERLCSSPRIFCEIHVEFTLFASFCEDYDSLILTKFTKLK